MAPKHRSVSITTQAAAAAAERGTERDLEILCSVHREVALGVTERELGAPLATLMQPSEISMQRLVALLVGNDLELRVEQRYAMLERSVHLVGGWCGAVGRGRCVRRGGASSSSSSSGGGGGFGDLAGVVARGVLLARSLGAGEYACDE